MTKIFVYTVFLLLVNIVDVRSTVLLKVDGTDSPGCGQTLSGCKTLAYAISEVVNNPNDYETISIGPGTYTGSGNRNVYFGKNIAIKSTNGAAATVFDCERAARGWVFINDNVTVDGVTLKNCVSDENSPGKPGAGFYIEASNIVFTNSLMDSHDAPSDQSAFGGAISLRSGNLVVENVDFTNNRAGVAGAVFMGGDSISSYTNCNFYNNSLYVGGWGGAIVPEEQSTSFYYNCSFELNTGVYGGAIDDGSTAVSTYYNCRFLNNYANYAGAYYGYGNTIASFYDCYFGYNGATDSGGAVRTTSAVTPIFENCYFEYNYAKSAPAIGLYGESDTQITGCTFVNHKSTAGNGGVAAIVGCSATITNSTFANVTGAESGGIIQAVGASVNIYDSIFRDSEGTTGGAIEQIESTVYIDNCKFINNQAISAGGAISVRGESFAYITNVEIIGGVSLQGGGIYVADRAEAYVADSVIQDSSATDGAGIYLDNTCAFDMARVTFLNNAAQARGGGLYFSAGPIMTSEHANFTGNSAIYGSGIYVQEGSSCSKYHLNDTLFAYNVASISGSVYFSASNESCSDVFGINTNYSNNQALYGADLSSSFRAIALDGKMVSAVYAGEIFSVSFVAKDFFHNSMAGKIDVQVHASTSTGMKLKGLNLEQIGETGDATFSSIAFTGLPGKYQVTFFTVPPSNVLVFPVEITPCAEGYKGYSTSATGDDFVCLKIDKLNKAALGVISAIDGLLILVTLGLMILFYLKRESAIIKRSQFAFCELVAFGALLNYISVYMWTDATNSMCGLRMYLMTIGLSIMLASLILKEIKIYLLFAAAAKMKNLQLKGRYMVVGTASAMFVAIVILIVWSSVSPAVRTEKIDMSQGTLGYICSSTHSEAFMWAVLGYEIFLMVCGAIVAFLSRNIPESFNESKYIAFSIYNFIVSLVVIVPLAYILNNSVTATYVVLGLGITFYTTVPLLMLFVPKLYYSYNKKAVIEKIDKEIATKQNEISLLRRQRRTEIEVLDLGDEYTLDTMTKDNSVIAFAE